jgi:hypothetical protein
VYLDDTHGNLADLQDAIVFEAYCETNSDKAKEDYDESFLWTFYRIQTDKGVVVFRWYGSSNGYYSEEVSFLEE